MTQIAMNARVTIIAMLASGMENELKSQALTVTGTVQEMVTAADEKVAELLAKSTMSTDIRYMINEQPGGLLLAFGSALKGGTIYTPSVKELETAKKVNAQFLKQAFSILNGIQVKKIVESEDGSLTEVDAAEGFLDQKGLYSSEDVFVVSYVKTIEGGKETGAELRMNIRRAFQLRDKLRLADGHVPIYLSGSTKRFMSDSEETHLQVLQFVMDFMKGLGKYKYFIGGRKGVLVFCDRPFGGYPVHKTFKALNINRMEHLLQLILARGIKLQGGDAIPMPKIINSKVADGIVIALTLEDGLTLGLKEGMYQVRMEGIISKGTIFVSEKITESFTNSESVKVKDLTAKELRPEDILFIGNSDSVYDMKISHQLGYVFIENFLEGKTKKPWGNIPETIAFEAGKVDKTTGESLALRSAAPVELSRLSGVGFPKTYMTMPVGAAKTAVKSLRPPAFKMYMLAIMPLEYLDRKYYKAAGIYTNEPVTLNSDDEGETLARIPFLAVGGGAQAVHTKDAKGKSLHKGYCFTPNVILIAMHEPILNDKGEVDYYPDDVEKGGNGASRILAKMITAMGADADGDRLAQSTKEGDLMLKSAGIKHSYDVPVIKSKNAYKGIDGWDENTRMKLWVVSTPLLMLVGSGDKITRNLVDIAFDGHISLNIWKKEALSGAEIVQRGVIAPKYSMTPKYKSAFTPNMIKKIMESKQVRSGFDFEGKLYDPALKVVMEKFREVYNDEHVEWTIHHPRTKWEGGYGFFWDKLALFNPEMGDNWVTFVEDAFRSELRRMMVDKSDTEAVLDWNKKFRNGALTEKIRRYIAQFIFDHKDTMDKEGNFVTDHSNVWAWMLSYQFTRPDYRGSMPAGKKFDWGEGAQPLPFISPEGEGWKFRTLEIMGMPFDLAALIMKEEKRLANIAGQ